MRSGLAVVLAALAFLTGCAGDTELAPPTPTSTDARELAAQRAVAALDKALDARDDAAARTVAAPPAQPLLEAVLANVRALDLQVHSVRYLEEAVLPPQDLAGHPPGSWGATIQLVWQLPEWDARESSIETAMLLDRQGRILGFAPGTDRVPLWLTGPLEVQRSPRVLVLSAAKAGGLGAAQILRLGRQAVAEVSDSLGWRGRLVLEVPDTERRLEQALNANEGHYATIAGVTSSVDGSSDAQAPVHVFLNPAVFGRLRGAGAQVVMTHEAVHVATKATASSAPFWLREGFADQIALDHAGVPVRTAAAQAIARVRDDGPPKELPTDADLSASAPGLGAAYEEAWLVCRYIAQTYGEDRLIAFYDAVHGGAPVAQALQDVLGTGVEALTRGWSQDLARLAGSQRG